MNKSRRPSTRIKELAREVLGGKIPTEAEIRSLGASVLATLRRTR